MSNFVIDQGKQVTDLEFPVFVQKLIQGVYEALLASDLAQVKNYVELVQELSTSLEDFRASRIADIQSAIGQTIALSQALDNTQISTLSQIVSTVPVLIPPDQASGDAPKSTDAIVNPKYFSGTSDQWKPTQAFIDVLESVADSEHSTLEQLVKIGVVRTVLVNGVISASFQLSAQQTNVTTSVETLATGTNFNTGGTANYRLSGIGKKGFKHSLGLAGYINYSKLRTSFKEARTYGSESSQLNYAAKVELNIASDYTTLKSS